ncbi:MAG TPA: aminotransferase class III-fold pyridoxal phosphate-dependent enzyme [Burkholderiales bacterium]|nr:aminotransferase class III-fold pyridoxal phosphate-dependent enzyme [Burkholderiales bacterium]
MSASDKERLNSRRLDESERLLIRALETIPQGSQTYSKSHHQFVRGAMPQFLARGAGCRVVDVDGNEYIDYVLGLLPIVLGYRDPDVDHAIRTQLELGITFSLPTALEADLAERLVRLIPCAEMVRFGKSGSDVTSAAVRLARAYTGREKIMICGYHGWHDWYIATTSRSIGIPEAVRSQSVPVAYGRLDIVESMLKAEPDTFAGIILEPLTAQEPPVGFLEGLRELTHRFGALLIFDEIVTGFRINLGGAQKEYGVTPDLACFGKAMANGMPISAVVGRRDVMMKMEQIFFSGTFGGEALSLAAAIATLDKLERENGPARIRRRGARLIAGANRLIEAHKLTSVLRAAGVDWWPRWKILESPVDANLLQSLLRQEATANGLLMLATLNLCLAHDDDAIEQQTLAALDSLFGEIKAALDDPDPNRRLRGEVIKPAFSVRPA